MKETIPRFFRKADTFVVARVIFIVYFLCSILLSLATFIRLLFVSDIILKAASIVMYYSLFSSFPSQQSSGVFIRLTKRSRDGCGFSYPYFPFTFFVGGIIQIFCGLHHPYLNTCYLGFPCPLWLYYMRSGRIPRKDF